MPRPNKLLIILGLVVLLLGIGTAIYLRYYTPKQTITQSPAIFGANLSYVEGEVEFKESGKEWEIAKSNQNLLENFIIRVNNKGRAIITLDDGSAIRLSANSSVTLTSLDPNNIVITNNNGEIYTRVVKLEREFKVIADDKSYISLGTAYKTINQEKLKGVEVYQSQVKIPDEVKSETLVAEGYRYYSLNETDKSLEKTVSQIPLDQLSNDAFALWNKEQDESNDAFKEKMGVLSNVSKKETASEATQPTTTTPAQNTTAKITLSATANDTGVKLTWTTSNLNSGNGYKIVKNKEGNPVYPGSDYKYINNVSQKNYIWSITDGKTYHFRVCEYLSSGKCGTYSNDVTATAPNKDNSSKDAISSSVDSISLSAESNGNVSWSVNGTSVKGFKMVWSKNSSPTYPTRDGDKYHYYSDATTMSGQIDNFSGDGTYYVRVCEYLGGKCGVYSNEVQIEMP
ncbi:MAG: FecR family protein [Bacteroidales bacterium]|jgi:hypothetical protein|nr:FecR family protein [Bacteroidales bacterium]